MTKYTLFYLSDNNQPRQDNSSIVIYIINPFDESNDKVLRRESYYALLRSFSEMAAGIPEKIRSRLVLEVRHLSNRVTSLATSCNVVQQVLKRPHNKFAKLNTL